ncbi:MAG: hypothetical protein AUI01_04205 [Ktedonobacter sp. 13_2_20CM_2_56_8]|nr:MAG: hypothetical protein AUI01_04205 [Ktedonobacter sp. 13_2_20CM_2_56_8]
MDLVQIDVIRPQALEAGVDRAEDMFSREAAVIGAWPHLKIHLGSNHHLVPGGKITQGFANNLFARPIGVDIGGVKEIDAQLLRALDKRPALRFIERPRPALGWPPVAHAAQANA